MVTSLGLWAPFLAYPGSSTNIHFGQYTHPMSSGRFLLEAGEYNITLKYMYVTKIHHGQSLECWSNNLSQLRFVKHVGQKLVKGWSKIDQTLVDAKSLSQKFVSHRVSVANL